MEHNAFTRLFERYGWTVEQLGENSYIAHNKNFFIPFSLDHMGYASAVSYFADDKGKFIEAWKKYNATRRFPSPIGYYAWHLYSNGDRRFIRWGGVGNHDHSTWEVENWLERLNGRR